MGKKYIVRLTEQELADLIAKKISEKDSNINDKISGFFHKNIIYFSLELKSFQIRCGKIFGPKSRSSF